MSVTISGCKSEANFIPNPAPDTAETSLDIKVKPSLDTKEQCHSFINSTPLPYGYTPSVFEHARPEINSALAPRILAGEIDTMIRFQDQHRRSRALFNYAPRFIPNTITFDRDNRPWILTGRYSDIPADTHYSKFDGRLWMEAILQTLSDDGEWVQYDLTQIVKELAPDDSAFDGTFYLGHRRNEFVWHDRETGNIRIYLHANTLKDILLQYSRETNEWSYIRYESSPVLEPTFIHSDLKVSVRSGGHDGIFIYEHTQDESTKEYTGYQLVGTYHHLPADQKPVHNLLDVTGHSGGVSTHVTIDNKTYVVYSTDKHIPDAVRYTKRPNHPAEHVNGEGTYHYLFSYNHDTGEIGDVQYLGTTYSTTHEGYDGHNNSIILADKEGHIHVVLGSHQRAFIHYKSKNRGDATEWHDGNLLYYEGDANYHITYPAGIFDSNDRLQLMVRQVVNPFGYYYSLFHMWLDNQSNTWHQGAHLVQPEHTAYSVFYHKLTRDNFDRLFVRYYQYDRLTDPKNPKPTEPEILFSKDNGLSWQLLTTDDLYNATCIND